MLVHLEYSVSDSCISKAIQHQVPLGMAPQREFV